MYLQIIEFALFLYICLLFHWHMSRRLRLPPGPPRLPFIGSLHLISDDYQQNTFSEWVRKYGDIVYARFFGNDVLVVNSTETARVLMEKRGAKYSSRPPFTFLCELAGFSWNAGFMRDTDRWKRHRRWFQYSFQVKRRLDEYVPIQQRETRRLLYNLLVTPDAYMSQIKRFAAAIMLEIGYGHTMTTMDDDYVRIVHSALEDVFLSGNPGSMMVDFVPLRDQIYLPAWLPGLTWKKTVTRSRPEIDNMNLSPFRAAINAVNSGSAKSSFATAILEEVSLDEPLSLAEEREMSGAVGTLYTAGTDTIWTITVLSTWLLAMVRHPEVYKRAQVDIDNVIGAERLPQLEDRDSLPFLECILKEGAPVPLSIAHQLTEDDIYNGYAMPRGAMVIPNIWAMSRDERMYDNPDEFRPERFLDLKPEVMERLDPRKYVFGHGRRICPGRFLGDSGIWLAMASITATFDITKVRDSAGCEVTPPPDFFSGFVRHPAPFSCVIRPRSEKSVELVMQSFQENSV
ncbi:cytochrome P450 [Fomitopsis betulina]|nr:cytochrome P450 [Fomitopsis betulina]